MRRYETQAEITQRMIVAGKAATEAALLLREAADRAAEARRLKSRWPDERLRRSNIDWFATLPSGVASSQMSWERSQTAAAMKACGVTLKEIAAAFGVSTTRATQIVRRAARKSPAQTWLNDRTFAPSNASDLESMAAFSRAAVSLPDGRDWLNL